MKKAFSLIELSIVIVIIGVLLSGVIQGSKLVIKSRLSAAQTLTETSIVNNLDNIVAWYETSLESSFLATELGNGNSISTWIDRNPKALTKNNATQNTALYKPTFTEDVFYSAIPALRFNSSAMNFDGTDLANNSYTIFVVEQRRSSGSNNYFLGGLTLATNQNLVLGYRANTTITQDHYANNLDVTMPAYSSPIPRIHTFVFDTTNGKSYSLNGTLTSSTAQTAALTSFASAAVGRYNTSFFIGDIAEVIIFKSRLKTTDQQAVESYLSKKYNI
jgi:prepilin-type N-terminal cleavage/methylation domain-containing protein